MTIAELLTELPQPKRHEIFPADKVIVSEISYFDKGVKIGRSVLNYDNPRLMFAKILTKFDRYHRYTYGISMAEKRFGFNTMVETESRIHESAIIGHNCVIGGTGFGYVKMENGELFPMPHLGIVVIEEGVRIGDNTCIDRAVLGETRIGKGTKIDNLVHIAHGVKIGENCQIVAGSVIGGSVEICDDCFIGINASIKNKVTIGKGVTIGMGAVVTKDVPDGETWIGNPARKL